MGLFVCCDSVLCLIDDLAADHGQFDLDILDGVGADGEDIVGQDSQVGIVAGQQACLGIGRGEEPFEGIGRGTLNIEHMPVVRDAEGGIGTPTSDHERTKMDLGTRHILVIINGYSGAEGLSEAASMTIELLQRYASATDCQSWMF